jgi:hypothetical protein
VVEPTGPTSVGARGGPSQRQTRPKGNASPWERSGVAPLVLARAKHRSDRSHATRRFSAEVGRGAGCGTRAPAKSFGTSGLLLIA